MGVSAATSLGRVGPYELLHKLATGGMSEIYEARRAGPHGFSKRIALKRILPQHSKDSELLAMFVDEARLCAQLSHPNLVQVFDFGEDRGDLYMAMELVEGTDCAKLVREVALRKETVPKGLALFIALSIARGLEHAHEACDEQNQPLRLVHRDVSPGNVLLSRSGAVKLSDFGIARGAFRERRTEHGQLKGKLGYMSPEQVLGRELDEKTDQFSTAIVLAEMLIGRPLFGGGREIDILLRIRDADLSNLARHGSHISEDVRDLLQRALARRAEDRFPTTRAFVEALEDVMRRGGFLVRPASLAAYLGRMGLAKPPAQENERALGEVDGGRSGPRLAKTEPCDPPAPRRYPQLSASLLRVAEPLRHEDARSPWYRVLLPSGEIGPVPLAEVARLFATGAASPTTQIAREHEPYCSAKGWPELLRVCEASEWASSEPEDEPTESFHIDRESFPKWLAGLMLGRRTGLLRVRHGERRTKAYFVDGVLEHASSTKPSDLLGSILIASGMVAPGEVERAVSISLEHGGRMGDALVALGALRPMALCRALFTQRHRRFVELLSWLEGEAAFCEGARSYEEDTVSELLPPFHLVTQGIREGYSSRELAELVARFESASISLASRPPIGLASLRLSGPEAAVLEMIDVPCRLSEIVERAVRENRATTEEARRAIFMGMALEMVRVGD